MSIDPPEVDMNESFDLAAFASQVHSGPASVLGGDVEGLLHSQRPIPRGGPRAAASASVDDYEVVEVINVMGVQPGTSGQQRREP